MRAFAARVVVAPGRLLRGISAETARGRLGSVIGVEGAEESGSALTLLFDSLARTLSLLDGALSHRRWGREQDSGERTGGCSGCQQSHNWTSLFDRQASPAGALVR